MLVIFFSPGIFAAPRRRRTRSKLEHRTRGGLVTDVVIDSGGQSAASKVLEGRQSCCRRSMVVVQHY